jgi:hypothetical protein
MTEPATISDEAIINGRDGKWSVWKAREADLYDAMITSPGTARKNEVWYVQFYDDTYEIRFHRKDDLLKYCRYRIRTGDRAIFDLYDEYSGEYMGGDRYWYNFLRDATCPNCNHPWTHNGAKANKSKYAAPDKTHPSTKNRSPSDIKPKSKTARSGTFGYGILRCVNCNQALNIPKGKHLKVTCPTCTHSWIHNDT